MKAGWPALALERFGHWSGLKPALLANRPMQLQTGSGMRPKDAVQTRMATDKNQGRAILPAWQSALIRVYQWLSVAKKFLAACLRLNPAEKMPASVIFHTGP